MAKMLHPPLPHPVLSSVFIFFFLPDAETNAPSMDSSTCYIIRNRFYSLVLTISNAYCILLLVLPFISFYRTWTSCMTDRVHTHTPSKFASSFGWGRTWLALLVSCSSVGSSTLTVCDVIRRFSGTVFSCLPYRTAPYPTPPYPSLLLSALSRLVGTEKESQRHCETADITRVTSELSIPFT